jgi:hypothetical protein
MVSRLQFQRSIFAWLENSNATPLFLDVEKEKTKYQDQKPQSQPKHSKLGFRRRRKPLHNEESASELASFIGRFERVNSLKKTTAEPWGISDVTGLLSQICKLENQDAVPLLPQGIAKASGDTDDPISSLFDSKTGLWKEMVIGEEDSNWQENWEFDSLPSNLRNVVNTIDEESQYIGELSVSPKSLRFQASFKYAYNQHRFLNSWRSIWAKPMHRVPTGLVSYEVEPAICLTKSLIRAVLHSRLPTRTMLSQNF